jgi:GNAT superfamily N-acetyltransferase
MSINFRPFNKYDVNYLEVIELYKEAFPGAQRIPTFLLRYKLRNGKEGFNILYENDEWIGLIYSTEYKDIVFVQFLAISELSRSQGYGSKAMESLGYMHSGKRIVLNIEELDELAENYQQRIKRKAFYQKNGFSSSGYSVKEPDERHEMLIRGGCISKEEIEAMYKHLLGQIIGFFIQPKVTKI